jgi:hypothetical protein
MPHRSAAFAAVFGFGAEPPESVTPEITSVRSCEDPMGSPDPEESAQSLYLYEAIKFFVFRIIPFQF